MLLNIWATFARNFVLENFQKLPNLVTLPACYTGCVLYFSLHCEKNENKLKEAGLGTESMCHAFN